MTRPIDCRVFEEQLDAAERGALPDDAAPILQAHAAVCASCAALLRLHERLPGPPLAELEARVPEEWVSGMEASVRRALEVRTVPRPASARPRAERRSPWIPALAAACLALLFATGATLRSLTRTRAQVDDLAGQLLDQQRQLTRRTSADGAGPSVRNAWLRSLRGRESLTLAEVRGLLEGLPPDQSLIGPTRVEALARSRLLPPPWRRILDGLPADGALTAGELRAVLDALDLPGGTPVPTGRILDLLS